MRLKGMIKFAAVALLGFLMAPSAFAAADALGEMSPSPTWRVLVYLDGDNNLDMVLGGSDVGVVETDLNELMAVGSTENVDVFTLVDRFEGPAELYRVLPGDLEAMTDYVFHGEEVNMGDPRTLRSFVSYTFNESSAQNTIIIFWDHGTPYYIALDDHPSDGDDLPDSLTHKEVIEALDGYHIDILGADECLVGQMEVAYEYATFADVDYLVASECYTGWRGIAYDRVLEEIDEDRDITPRELALAMTDHFIEQFSVPPYKVEMVNSKAAVDLSRMEPLAQSMLSLAGLLASDMDEYYSLITSARGDAPILYGGNAISRIDMGVFLEGLSEGSLSEEAAEACSEVLEAYSEAVMAIGTTKVTEDMHTGLGIYLPLTPNHSLEEYMLGGSEAEYRTYEFPRIGWMDFIESYWAVHGGLEAGHT